MYSHDNGRPCGEVENAWTFFHNISGGGILAETLVLRSKKQIKAAVVKKAMELLMKRHPLLCMCIRKNQGGDNCFQKMENVCVNLCQLDTKDWKNVMEESLLIQKKFDTEKGPLWRGTFLPNARYEPPAGSDSSDDYEHEYICILNFHHAIIDGMSCCRIFGEFTKYVMKFNAGEYPEVCSMAMLPPADVFTEEVVSPKWYLHLVKLSLELFSIIPGLLAFLMRAVGMSLQGNCFTRKYDVEIQRNPQIQPRTKIIPVEFTKDETACLLKKCKEFQTTVQGAVQVAAGVAMVIMLEEQEYEVECELSVNSRPVFKSTPLYPINMLDHT